MPLAPVIQQPRAQGDIALSVKNLGLRTGIDRLRQSGSFKCLFPRPQGPEIEAVLVNTAGGITGGDAFTMGASAAPDCQLTLTTQAAERAYRAQPGEMGRIENQITVGARARVHWLPQETILFDGCALTRSLTVDLAPDAQLLVVEPVVFGRTFRGEVLTQALFHDRIDIRRDGQPLYLDGMHLAGNIAAQLDHPHCAAGAQAMAQVILVAPFAERLVEPVRALLPATAGASLIGADLLAVRVLASDSHILRQSLIPILTLLSQKDLPRCWMI